MILARRAGNHLDALGVTPDVGVAADGGWAVASLPAASVTGPIVAVVWPTDLVSLYRSRYADMVRLAFLLTGSAAEAEEIVQDSFVRIRSRVDRVDNPAAYLRTTVVNACRNRHRRVLVERRHNHADDPSIHDHVDELSDALARLSTRQRTVIVLRFYAGLTEAEIADALGCRPGTVKSLCHRGLAELRQVIEP